ncbi:hypothetical protein [Catalinimonas niigatensis]|uniref:hypothetical protein n=1 Tax=Catalinimonas niigatensis TaxID=1397264 RepID=UPI002666ECBB|nr:hypothetical protein [Catalinimonas niigatensis]WPP49102.1 hypothetical protein PZB72_20755 [Catalinimonas niigatensis]
MKNSTNFSINNFDQEAYNDADFGFDTGFDDFLFEQIEEVTSEEIDLFDLDDYEEDEDNFDGVF